jgi:hypothetical protein
MPKIVAISISLPIRNSDVSYGGLQQPLCHANQAGDTSKQQVVLDGKQIYGRDRVDGYFGLIFT